MLIKMRFSPAGSGSSTSELIQGVGRIQFLIFAGLRSSFSWWLFARVHSELLENTLRLFPQVPLHPLPLLQARSVSCWCLLTLQVVLASSEKISALKKKKNKLTWLDYLVNSLYLTASWWVSYCSCKYPFTIWHNHGSTTMGQRLWKFSSNTIYQGVFGVMFMMWIFRAVLFLVFFAWCTLHIS